MATLDNVTIAILATDGFEESELVSPKRAIEQAGGTAKVVSTSSGTIQANRHREHGETVPVDETLQSASADSYDGLVIPGGLFSPDHLRVDDDALGFVRAFFEADKPVAAICHGPQILISAGLVDGRTMTAIENIRTDLKNAGATVKDEKVVKDGLLITSRNPDDLDAFNAEIIETFASQARKAA